jgi:hypothetical protein
MPLTESGVNPQRRQEIRDRLLAIDAESVRPLRAIVKDEATDFDRTKLAELEAEAAQLRQELAALEK